MHRRLEIRVYGRGEFGAASVALAMVPEETVGDSTAPAVAELEVECLVAGGGGHHTAAWKTQVQMSLLRYARQMMCAVSLATSSKTNIISKTILC